MAAGSIVVELLARTGSFETDIQRSTKAAEKRLRELQKEAETIGVAIGAAFTAAGVASAAIVKHAIDTADEMGKMAQKVGSTVEELSALAYVANLTGPSQEQLGQAMVKLAKNMGEAAEGSGEAGKAFAALGINVKNSDGTLKSSAQVLTEIAGKFAGFRDSAEKTALAVELFGRSGAELIPLLNVGAEGISEMTDEARQLGVVLDTDMAKAAENFNDNLSRMGAAVSGVANRAAAELLPALNSVSEMLVSVAKDEATVQVATDLVKGAVGGLITIFQTISVVGSDVGFVFQSVGREIGAWAAQLAALARGDWQGFHAISDAVKADGERARAELDKFQAKIMSIGQPAYRDPRLLGDVPSIAAQTQGWRAPAPRMPSGTPKVPRSPAPPRAKAEKPFETSDRFSEADALEREAQMLNEAQQAWAKYAVALPVNDLTALNSQMTETQSLLEGTGFIGVRALEDLATGGAKFSDVLKSVLLDLGKLVFQIGVAEPLMRQLRQAMGGGVTPPNTDAGLFSGVGSSIGSYFSSVLGFADGGSPPVGRPSLVGERGPELFVPRTAGMVVPLDQQRSGTDWTIVNQTTGRVDRATEHRLSPNQRALLLQENEAGMAASLANPNSKLSQAMQRHFNVRPKRS